MKKGTSDPRKDDFLQDFFSKFVCIVPKLTIGATIDSVFCVRMKNTISINNKIVNSKFSKYILEHKKKLRFFDQEFIRSNLAG